MKKLLVVFMFFLCHLVLAEEKESMPAPKSLFGDSKRNGDSAVLVVPV